MNWPHTGQPEPSRIGKRTFRWGERTYIMSILNVSPDSFSGDGIADPDLALDRALEMEANGADIIDVGGESTRPDAEPISPQAEIARVVPVMQRLSNKLKVPLSIDTYKYEVAQCALQEGAVILNDVWGLRKEPRLAELAARHKVPIIITANQRGQSVQDILQACCKHLEKAILTLDAAGVARRNIILDPGIGFGKTAAQNLVLIECLGIIRTRFRLPILLGASRKSFIGAIIEGPPSDRIFGTAAVNAVGISRGADIIRVHETREMRDLARVADAITRRGAKTL
jgi:dihydropteroate synthase